MKPKKACGRDKPQQIQVRCLGLFQRCSQFLLADHLDDLSKVGRHLVCARYRRFLLLFPSRLRGRVSFLGIVVVLFFSSQSRLVVEGLRAV